MGSPSTLKMRFFIEFCSKNALLQQRRHRFRIGFSNTFCLSGTFLQIAFRMHFGSKNLPKTSPKRGPNPSKIDAKNVSFFSIDFFGFWTRFWTLLGLQLGAKSAALRAAPGVLKPTAFFACINMLLFQA